MKFFYRKNKDGFTDEEMNIYLNFCSTVHSMFRISRLTFFKKDLVITDLFSKKNYTVKNVELKSGFTQGDIFEARLIPFGGHYEFSKGFCFHPIEVGSFILGEIQKVKYQDKEQKTKLILQLADMKLKHLRFQHIDIKHIYSFASRI
ncbi:MAG: hypothetical protein HY072_01030 [Deltaproteobacteria bacterium]|nr:hypothetical protein [Deltaproteobacteria bacterium]